MSETYDVVEIPRKDILVDYKFNSRGMVFPYQVDDLVENLKTEKLQTPVSVEPYDDPTGKYKYRLLCGFRREKAFEVLGRDTIPCFIQSKMPEDEARKFNITENLARQNLNKVQEAEALDYFFKKGWSDSLVAEYFNQSVKWVMARRIILTLPESVKKLVAADLMSHEQILKFKSLDALRQDQLIRDLKDGKFKLEQLGVKPTKPGSKIDKRYFKATVPPAADVEALKLTLYDSMGPSMMTRCIAYIQGYIPAAEFWTEVRQHIDNEGYEFKCQNKGICEMLDVEPWVPGVVVHKRIEG